ncbi:hypothetical protein GCM10009639_64920 [Kitasatospora putterlickiae]|uniref:Uncharacterized protein n=1 Tax=Kitasatospora putterlickiae TaxID=221725 RepID=A0ABP4J4Z8_9ACTN
MRTSDGRAGKTHPSGRTTTPPLDEPSGAAVVGSGQRPRRHFHWVETPKPAAMKPKPTRMFQFRQLSTGQLPLVT